MDDSGGERLALDRVKTAKAVQSGSFAYDYRYRYTTSGTPPVTTAAFSAQGDVSAFQSFSNDGSRVSFGSGSGPQDSSSAYFNVNLTFNNAGAVAGGNVDYSTDGYYVFIDGTNGTFTGSAGFGNAPAAEVSGALLATTSVPEPASIVILGAVIGLVGLRRYAAVAMSKAE